MRGESVARRLPQALIMTVVLILAAGIGGTTPATGQGSAAPETLVGEGAWTLAAIIAFQVGVPQPNCGSDVQEYCDLIEECSQDISCSEAILEVIEELPPDLGGPYEVPIGLVDIGRMRESSHWIGDGMQLVGKEPTYDEEADHSAMNEACGEAAEEAAEAMGDAISGGDDFELEDIDGNQECQNWQEKHAERHANGDYTDSRRWQGTWRTVWIGFAWEGERSHISAEDAFSVGGTFPWTSLHAEGTNIRDIKRQAAEDAAAAAARQFAPMAGTADAVLDILTIQGTTYSISGRGSGAIDVDKGAVTMEFFATIKAFFPNVPAEDFGLAFHAEGQATVGGWQ